MLTNRDKKGGKSHKNDWRVSTSWCFWNYPKPNVLRSRYQIDGRHATCATRREKVEAAWASERLFAPRDYNGYGKAGLNPLEWAYEWSPFSVIIGALSTRHNAGREIGMQKSDAIPLSAIVRSRSYRRRAVAPPPFRRAASVFEYFVASIPDCR